ERLAFDPGRRLPGARVPRTRPDPARARDEAVGEGVAMRRAWAVVMLLGTFASGCARPQPSTGAADHSLWALYQQPLVHAKYVDLTHEITPQTPVWPGFGPPTFGPTLNPANGKPYTFAADGFEATRYLLPTDQLGTQLD